MKIKEFENGVEIFLSDTSCDEYDFKEGEIFPDTEFPDEFLRVTYLTIVHPEIPKKAWIVIPEAVNVSPRDFCSEFIELWQRGAELSSVAHVLKEKYFGTDALSDFFDKYCNADRRVLLHPVSSEP